MFAIILAIVAIICCILAAIVNAIDRNFGVSLLFVCLAVLNGFLLKYDIDRYHAIQSGEYETIVVENVIGYSVDTIQVINGADTTKTYTLTYWKDYE